MRYSALTFPPVTPAPRPTNTASTLQHPDHRAGTPQDPLIGECDGKLPTCSQCCLTGRECGGYKLDPVFIPYKVTTLQKSSRKGRTNKRSSEAAASTTGSKTRNVERTVAGQPPPSQICRPVDSATPQEFTAVVLSCFIPKYQQGPPTFDLSTSQVCGAWVGILPGLVARVGSGSRKLLYLATQAFAASILDSSTQAKSKSFHSQEAYHNTLQRLNKELVSMKSFFSVETAAAIVCLAMVELMLPISDNGIHAHTGGLGALINLSPPDLFSRKEFHAIFIGCRPVLLFQALAARKSTFLAQENWLRIPFRHHPPSAIQALISDGAVIPSIMEAIDILPTLPWYAAVMKAHQLKAKLEMVLGRLSRWNDRFGRDISESPGPILKADSPQAFENGARSFWFPSLVAANVHTHMWAFEIVSLVELDKLTPYLPGEKDVVSTPDQDEEPPFARITTLASKICQCMEYLLQEDLKLFGPAAALFPLNIAYEVLSKDEEGNKQLIARCWQYFDLIRHRGISSKAIFPPSYRDVCIDT
ncbi:predicted protein [Plenodomus lingam JN3]|uniref:Predicted protein n=1 Tax=Leptosphaeria maculans (strain JN3 / isolate v23.1.3 / race Av1-4-5-6-7-8) TaxID=985895 RepID=E5ADC3_LEPMJ|nr:predicted protein [Plenodomus lingam JN3]CBY02475.1 predicted protein [Plenodomus lingam JN3]